MLKQTVEESKIHKDKNRHNEFDDIYMPRATVINWPIQGKGYTVFYAEDKHACIGTVSYTNESGAILNTGGYNHNVILSSDQPRIVFQLCFDTNFERVKDFYEKDLSMRTY